MKRRVFSILAAISLLVLVAVSVVWVRSYLWSEALRWERGKGTGTVRSARGQVEGALWPANHSGDRGEFFGLTYTRGDAGLAAVAMHVEVFLFPGEGRRSATGRRWGGFAWYAIRGAGGEIMLARAVVPLWCIALAAGALPVAWTALRVRSHVAGRRRSGGVCAVCGYDLRATPGRCPECGCVPTSSPSP